MTKIYLHLRDNRTKLFHHLALHLQQTGFASQIGASVVGREGYNYLKSQSQIDYSPLILEAEYRKEFSKKDSDPGRLRELESEFGDPFLNFYLTLANRFGPDNYNQQKSLVQHWFDLYLNVFSEFQPDIFLTDDVGHLSKVIPFQITNRRYGQSIRWHSTRIANRYAFSKTVFDRFSDISDLHSKFITGSLSAEDFQPAYSSAVDYLEDFRTQGMKPQYSNSGTQIETSINDKLKTAAQYAIKAQKHNYSLDYMRDSTLTLYRNYIESKCREKRLTFGSFFDEPNYENFAFFPLHLQPEWSTIVIAQPFLDQTVAVRQLAANLPLDYDLYVKDHPRMFGSRPISYYKKLQDIPNVKVIDPRLDSHRIIKQSNIVATITGTAALESAMLDTPSITFGDPHFTELSTVKNVSKLSDLDNLVHSAISQDDEKTGEVLQFLTAVFEESFASIYPSQVPEESVAEEAKKISENLKEFY